MKKLKVTNLRYFVDGPVDLSNRKKYQVEQLGIEQSDFMIICSPVQIFIPYRMSGAFHYHLCELCPSRYLPRSRTYGRFLGTPRPRKVIMSTVVQALLMAGVGTVAYFGYGMKTPVEDMLPTLCLLEEGEELEIDVGWITYSCPSASSIPICSPRIDVDHRGITTFPMFSGLGSSGEL